MKEELKKKVVNEIRERPGEYSLYFKDLDSKENLFVDIDRVFLSASIIKIPIIIEVFRQAELGMLKLNNPAEIAPGMRVGGSGIIQELSDNTQLSIRDLAVLMITLSDNTATNVLIDLTGIENINTTIQELGLKNTILERKMMDYRARKEGKDNYTTARDMGELLEKIHSGKIPGLSRSSTEEILRILTRQVYRDCLSFYIPEKLWKNIGSKTGTLDGIIHDASIFDLEQARYVLVMMSRNLPANAVGRETQARVSKMIYDYWELEVRS